MSDLQRSAKIMREILASQHSRRHEYRGTDWLYVEIDVMHHAVNCDRSKRGLPDIPRSLVVRLEACAAGHTDYASKFGLYCAELAMGVCPIHQETATNPTRAAKRSKEKR
jgi:hypothetical protein